MAVLKGGAGEPASEVVVLPVGREATAEAYRRRQRRSWTPEEKLAIVQEAESSGAPVAEVARRHGMNANHLFNWIQRHRDGTLDRRAAPPAVEPEPMTFLDLGLVGEGRPGAGMIEIELPNRVRLRVGAQVEVEALRRVLTALKALA